MKRWAADVTHFGVEKDHKIKMEDPGVSRSGRIRKKSSKLVDYESVDEIPPPEVIRSMEKNRRGSVQLESRNSEEVLLSQEDFEAIPSLGAEWDDEAYAPKEKDFLQSPKYSNGVNSTKNTWRTSLGNPLKSDISAYASWAKVARDKLLKSPSYRNLHPLKLHQRLRNAWSNLSKKERVLWANRARRYNKYIHSKASGGKGLKVIKGMESNNLNSGSYKVVGTDPIDSAAHLKLLGESLSIIGERLTEHEGQIAVSGSLSVLLDSLLCAMGPLMCLTRQVPELNTVPQERLSSILDNVAYIMPGL